MRHPTLSKTSIVFQFADDLWSVPREGGAATRLTSAPGIESDPFFSPDGSMVAFTGIYDGNYDVYVVPAEGGVPKRLTAHPSPDMVTGWTPDGKDVVFSSSMLSNTDLPRLFTVHVTGGFPKPLPLPSGTMASFSPDGQKLAYVPGIKWEDAWKRYRGGQTYPIWIANMSDSKVKEIPRRNTNDEQPTWVGQKIFYLSDPTGPVGLYSYDTVTGKETEEVKGEGFDIKSLSAGPGAIVYEKLGSINLLDLNTRQSHRVPIQVHGDFAEVRPQFKSLTRNFSGASISPSGARVAISARGWVFTAPASKGDIHVLDETQGVHRRDPAWSPDGRTVAYITDVNNRQQLGMWDVSKSKETTVDLGESPGFYYSPVWSPDSSKLSYTDNKRNLWVVDVKSGVNTKIDSTIFNDPTHTVVGNWSPDSKWLTWSRDLENHLNAIFVYNLDSGKKTQITDGFANADSPIFDRDGKLLYFYASTNMGQGTSWLDLSSFNSVNVVSSVYAVVLKKDQPNPLQPESDEETPKEAPSDKPSAPVTPPNLPSTAPTTAPKAKEGGGPASDDAAKKKPEAPKFGIDVEGIESRIIALPLPNAIYVGLEPATPGSFFAIAAPPRAMAGAPSGPASIGKFSFTDRKFSPFASGVVGMQTTADGTKALLMRAAELSIVPTQVPPQPGQGSVDLSGLRAKIDPKVEWNHMYHEVWRNERLLFYAPNLNGIDASVMERRYEPFLKNIASRDDLNYLFVDMLGELTVGHEFPGGGDIPSARRIPGGLLGADFEFANGRYRLARIYTGERWNPELYAPLAQPGINAKTGEYLLEIDGKDLTEATDVYEALEAKAGKQVKVKLGPTPDGKNSREVTVVPVGNEFGLRSRAWEEDNRRYVEKMTNGRGGYMHVPDTAEGGWAAFNRYYYAEVGKDGIVIDERFNHGGLINDFMIREMQKPMDAAFAPRYGRDWPTPGSAIFGPKVMLANQFAGSGGDMFPWLFKHEKVGPVIGKRTWGGLIAAFGFELPDGGRINAPDNAFYNTETGKWDVENWGVPPDIEVELDPYLWRQGHDAQLDRGIEELNKRLANYKPPVLKRPAYPDRSKVDIRY
jgi:tricorn protease